MSSYMAVSYKYLWRQAVDKGFDIGAPRALAPSNLEQRDINGGARALVLELLEELSMVELLEISAAAAAAAAKLHGGATSAGAHSSPRSTAIPKAAPKAAATASGEIGGKSAMDAEEDAEEEPGKFRSRRPFHPDRLAAALTKAQSAFDLCPTGDGGGGASLHGIAWLATQSGLQALLRVDGDGVVCVEPGDAWWACVPKPKWPPGLANDIGPLWQEPHGDRQTELFLPEATGAVEQAALTQLASDLKAALVDDGEWEDTSLLSDPFAHEWETALRATEEEERAARILDEVESAFRRNSIGSAVSLFGGVALCTPCVGSSKIKEAVC